MNPDAAPLDPQATTDTPLLAGRYQLLDKLGEGGMGAVFRARDLTLQRFVAVKILPTGKLQDADAIARFRREARALAKLSHPNIIQAHDSGQDGDKHFLVMELVEGRSLAAVLAEKGRLAPTLAADYAQQAAQALHHAHRLGLIHRDVKPSNLLVDAEGRVKLLDLGLARFLQDQIGDGTLTREGAGMGTPDYCSPEQFREAHKADARSDIYSLGCTLYHLIAGRPPFPGSSLSEKAKAHHTQEPSLEEISPEMPGGLALTLARMLAKRPADRFTSMAEVAEALTPYVASSSPSFRDLRTTATWSGGQLETMTAYPRRRAFVPWLVAAAAMLMALGAVARLGYVQLRGEGAQVAQPNVSGGNGTANQTIGEPPRQTVEETADPKLPAKKEKEPSIKPVRDDPNLLTVSKDPKDKGEFRNIGEAMAAVDHVNMIIRVLDEAEYVECVQVRDPARAGLTLEAPRHATLVQKQPNGHGVSIDDVPGVTVRGFKVRIQSPTIGVAVRGACPGVILEDLDITSPKETARGGIAIDNAILTPEDRPILVQNCRVAHCTRLVILGTALPNQVKLFRQVVLRNNRLEHGRTGIALSGEWSDVHIVANRIFNCSDAGIRFHKTPAPRSILIANNTIVGRDNCLECYRLEFWKDVRVCNNYFLDERGFDISIVESSDIKVPTSCRFDHNARPGASSVTSVGYSPTYDLTKKELGSPTRSEKLGDFPAPAPGSPLATKGVGQDDPSLPAYIGAVPPKNALPWDWDRTWRLPRDAPLLTVSKEESDGGKYRTINDALKDAQPWATIRVLDEAEYQECLSLKDKAKFEGLTLEAPKRAALVMAKGDRSSLQLRGVPHLRLSGFRFRDRDKTPVVGRAFISATGDLTGTTLADLDISAETYSVGIALQQVSSGGEPLVVTRCSIKTFNDSILVAGNPALGVCRGVRLSANRIRSNGPGAHGILLTGALEDVWVTGNMVYDCKTVGLQIQDPAPSFERVLLANNTVCNCGEMGFRLWENGTSKKHGAGQVEFSNNLLFGCGATDAAYVVAEENSVSPGDMRELMQSWRFRGNTRDMAGTEVAVQIPRANLDRVLAESDLLSSAIETPDRIRPASQSPLAKFGINSGAGLPVYVGAVPPEGVEPWNWDRTWRTRMRSKEK